MVTKTKRVLALLLTGMMAASALAGCASGESTTTTPSGNGGSTSTTPAASTGTEGDSSTASQPTGDTVDFLSDAMVDQVKDMIRAEAKDGKVTLKVWCSSDDNAFESWLVKQFEDRYQGTDYKLKIKTTSIEEPDVSSKLQADVSKGADVFSFPDDQIRGLVDTGCLARVSDTLYNNVIAENTDASVTVCSIDGVPYAFPKTSDNGFFLYYDKRYIGDEDITSFTKLLEKANSQGKSVLYSMDNAWYNAGFFFAAGCTSSYDGKTQTTNFDSAEGLSAAKAMCEIAKYNNKGLVGTGGNADVLSGFRTGSLAAAITGTWNGPGIKEAIGEENLGAAKLPTIPLNGEEKQLWSFGGYKVEGVRANTDYPNTAQLLAYYMTSKQSQLYRYGGSNAVMDGDKNISRGLIPTNKEALATDELKADAAAAAIEAQRPFSYPQSNVGGKFWTPQGTLGGYILGLNGEVSEADLQTQLTKTVNGFNS